MSDSASARRVPWWRRLLVPFLGWPCPDCGVNAGKRHRPDCPTGSWDGGTWA